MMAAGRAAECGANVLLIERGPKLGCKLRISGKGRANITNTADIPEFIEAFSPNGKFLHGAFSRFFRDDLIGLLREQGVETITERGGRVFPTSQRAGDVADALEKWLESRGARVKLDVRAKSIDLSGGRVTGVKIFGGRIDADAVVIATGGASYPKTGSTGDGYDMARALGHTINPPRPALSSLVTKENWVKDLRGLSLRNVEATLYVIMPPGMIPGGIIDTDRPRKIGSEFGEMLFTHFGISGPIILTLSRGVSELLDKNRVFVSIDLKPALTKEQLHARLIREFSQTRHLGNYLKNVLPKLLIEPILDMAEVDNEKPVNSITADERTRIVDMLKDLRVTVIGMSPLEEAIVTAGGVPTREIDPRTMMSKLVEGLFFAGEVIDIDGRTGGFNLQAAFSTGYVAGESAAANACA